LLQHDDRQVRLVAAKAVWHIQGDAKGVMPVLLAALSGEPSGSPACLAAEILKEMGPAAAAALPVYREMLQDKDERRRSQAVELLGALGPKAAPAVASLGELLRKCARADEREPIIETLRKIGPAARPALPLVLAAANAPENPSNSYERSRARSRRLKIAVATMEISDDVQPLVDYLPQAIEGAEEKASFTSFDGEEKAIKAAAEKFPAQSRSLLPAVNLAYQRGLLLPGAQERLLFAIGGFPAWLRYAEGAWLLWIAAVLLACLVIEVAVFRWGWKGRAGRLQGRKENAAAAAASEAQQP
jgi:hypothetical protein